MKKFVHIFMAVSMVLVSCSEATIESYHINGSSSVSLLDGSKLYLKVPEDTSLAVFDSCEVVHGTFAFEGNFDTTKVAHLFMDNQSLMPVVIELGNIDIRIDKASQKVSGTPLNNLLYEYLDKHMQIVNRSAELSHREAQMFLEGYDEETIYKQLSAEAAQLPMQKDSLETHFIIENLNNALGPYAFQMLAEDVMTLYGYPVLTPQIEQILMNAPECFKANFYVKSYCKAAEDIEAKLKGDNAE